MHFLKVSVGSWMSSIELAGKHIISKMEGNIKKDDFVVGKLVHVCIRALRFLF